MDNHQLQLAFDACRLGHDDLQEPEMSALAEQLKHDPQLQAKFEAHQQWEAKVAHAFRTPPVPEGMQARLLAALAAGAAPAPLAEIQPSEQVASESKTNTVIQPASPSAPALQSNRRNWLAWCSAAAILLVVVGVSAAWLFTPASSITPHALAQQSVQWVEQAIDDGQWRRQASRAAFESRPTDRRVAGRPIQWQAIGVQLDSHGVAYQYSTSDHRDAYLLVLRDKRRVANVDGSPPQHPIPETTGGWTVGAWRNGELLYVLVVNGSAADYRNMLRDLPTA